MKNQLPTINIKRHRTINSCLAAYFSCKVKDLDSIDGDWVWMNSFGEYHSCPNQDKIKEIRKENTWGWICDKNTIHLFIRKKATMAEIIYTVAHEFGHTHRPFHRNMVEEQKASKYADVAIVAYELAELLKTSKCNSFIACPTK
jgi:hypothetical protein